REMAAVGCFAKVIDAQIAGDCVSPSGELRFVFERTCILDDSQKNLLEQVLCCGGCSDLTEHEVEERSFVTLDDDRERGDVAPLVAGHQGFVGNLGPRGATH